MKNGVIDKDKLYDVIIVGGGPAGLTAAIYLSRAKYRVLVIEKEEFGGQINITDEVVNYPGIVKTSGRELTGAMKLQGEHFGAEFIISDVSAVKDDGDFKIVSTTVGDYRCFGVLIATGAHPRTIGFKGEEKFKGRGVAYCATCDGEFFTGKEIFVIGGGFAAAEESIFLTKFASHVTILVREPDFTCAKSIADKVKSTEKISVLYNTEVLEVDGENGLDYIRYKNNVSGETCEYRAKDDFFGVFVFAGYVPSNELVKGLVKLDDYGYIITDTALRTNVEGIYAAGDICIKPLRQVVTATSDGALAATELEKYVTQMQRKTGITPTAKAKESPTESGENPHMLTDIFDEDIKNQLRTLFERFDRNITLRLYLDEREISRELEAFIIKLVSFSDKLSLCVAEKNLATGDAPFVRLCVDDEPDGNIAFHGVPSGHEFTPFISTLYALSCGAKIDDDDTENLIRSIEKDIKIKVLVTLSCSMCPELVSACEKIAVINPKIDVQIYDIRHFEEIRAKYNAMSVPCLVINDDIVHFGKKNIREVAEILSKI